MFGSRNLQKFKFEGCLDSSHFFDDGVWQKAHQRKVYSIEFNVNEDRDANLRMFPTNPTGAHFKVMTYTL
jgi:hypothetical protein